MKKEISSRVFCNRNWGLDLRQQCYNHERWQGTPVTMQKTMPVWLDSKWIKSKNDDVTTAKEFSTSCVSNE